MYKRQLYESPAIERLGIPEYNWWNEALHGVARAGVATVFPQAIGLAATFDTDLIEKIGDVVSTEGRGKFNEFSKKGCLLYTSIGVSVETDNQNEQIEFVFQMYGKQDLYGGGTNLKVKLTGDGMERKIYPVSYTHLWDS